MEPVYNFTWRGEDAFSDHGVCTMAIGSTVIAERRDKTFTVAGRSGLVHHQDAMSNANNHMAGDFPLLTPGNVAVSWSLGEESTLTSVTISPRWRDEN